MKPYGFSDFRPQKKPKRENWNQTGRRGEEGMWSGIRDQMSGGGAGESLRSFAHKSQRTEGRWNETAAISRGSAEDPLRIRRDPSGQKSEEVLD
ncbi:hypothetical protein D4764_08G0000250 [Takifugu flavidus]|uniref:Uncharacterized protein n=1 Tax=Takifugu flavidus TaxID=433684 RepID=A0A5C6MN19_9TELE|nr:hypothetical protein D4764_08G0000250 [Takifugu flavidus]